jgi:hypothetical protein
MLKEIMIKTLSWPVGIIIFICMLADEIFDEGCHIADDLWARSDIDDDLSYP